MALKAVDIAFAMYPVDDMPKARHFYENVLGLKTGTTIEFSPGVWWIEYDIGTTAIAITNFEQPVCTKGPAIAIEVTNYDEALASFKAAGIPITWGPNDFPPCNSFGIKDPAGNDLYIHQRKKVSS